MALREASTASDPESVFLASLPHISRVAEILGHRYGLSEADVEEFGSWAQARMIEGDYAVFRKFAGRSSLPTYLSVVVTNLFKDFRNSRWGRWRPSASAQRLGALAVRFETLVYRDGHPAREAMEVLKATGAAETELRTLATKIPVRTPAREVSFDTAFISVPAPEQADGRIRTSEEDAEQARLSRLLGSALAELPPEDQVIVRLRFWDDFSIADIARTLHIDQKPLYRRLEGIQATLTGALQRHGVTREQVAEMIGREGGD